MSTDRPYVSSVHVVRSAGPNRVATLPTGESVTFGVHSDIAHHYGIDVDARDSHAATLDYVVAALGAAMVGTFARTLRDEGIVVGEGDLQADVLGSFADDEGELVLTDVEVVYVLTVDSETAMDSDRIDRAHATHAPMCPLVKTLRGCMSIASRYEVRVR